MNHYNKSKTGMWHDKNTQVTTTNTFQKISRSIQSLPKQNMGKQG